MGYILQAHLPSPEKRDCCFFAYGTLRRAYQAHVHAHASEAGPDAEFPGQARAYALLRKHGSYEGQARCRATLVEVRGYPGLLLPEGNTGHSSYKADANWVVGELFFIQAEDLVFPYLDVYEGCETGSTKPTEYLRKRVIVESGQGSILRRLAWTYVYNWCIEGLAPIPGGDYLGYLKSFSAMVGQR